MKKFKSIGVYILILVLVFAAVVAIRAGSSTDDMSYDIMISMLESDNVKSINVEGNEASVRIKKEIKVPVLNEKGESSEKILKTDVEYKVDIIAPGEFQNYLTALLSRENAPDVRVNENVPTDWFSIIMIVTMIASVIVIAVIFLGGKKGGVANFGRSRARLYTNSKVKFDDVAGADEEKEEMKELVDFLRDPKKYTDMGARIPKGVLMVGPPGTGKTYLAKAIAGEAGVPFFSISGSDFVEMYVGVGASRVRDLFEQAKKMSPALVFIDEIDAVGRHRGAGMGGGNDEREQTLNQLLVEMDGFTNNNQIIVIAATNRPDILDPALTRPGRFDRKIVVGYPDLDAREKILRVHSKNKRYSDDVDLRDVAKNTVGFTPADLENLLNEAALLAARDNLRVIMSKHIKEATFKVIVGPEKKSRKMTDEDKRLTAYHEAGHAITVKIASPKEKVDRISIIPAGSAGGYTASRPETDETYRTKSQLIAQIIVALGGKAAEELIMGEVSTGASSDLQKANSIAMKMVTRYGMSDKVGNRILEENDEVFLGRDYGHVSRTSESLSSVIDSEVKLIIDSAYAQAKQILQDNMEKLHIIAQTLLEKEKIEGEEFEEIMAQ